MSSTTLASARKAVMAFGIPLVAKLGESMADGSLTGSELVIALGFGLVTGVVVYKVPNADD